MSWRMTNQVESHFGAPLSTRALCAREDYLTPPPAEAEERRTKSAVKGRNRQRNDGSDRRQNGGASTVAFGAAPAAIARDLSEAKKRAKLKRQRDFSGVFDSDSDGEVTSGLTGRDVQQEEDAARETVSNAGPARGDTATVKMRKLDGRNGNTLRSGLIATPKTNQRVAAKVQSANGRTVGLGQSRPQAQAQRMGKGSMPTKLEVDRCVGGSAARNHVTETSPMHKRSAADLGRKQRRESNGRFNSGRGLVSGRNAHKGHDPGQHRATNAIVSAPKVKSTKYPFKASRLGVVSHETRQGIRPDGVANMKMKQSKYQPPKASFNQPSQQYATNRGPAAMQWKKQQSYYGHDNEYVDDGFIVDEAEPVDTAFVFSELRKMTGYDPSRFRADDFDDRRMEVGFAGCQAEEKRSSRLGREEDLRQEILDRRRAEEKEARMKSRLKR